MPSEDQPLVAVVEIPKGSSNKYEWDEELGAIKLDSLLSFQPALTLARGGPAAIPAGA